MRDGEMELWRAAEGSRARYSRTTTDELTAGAPPSPRIRGVDRLWILAAACLILVHAEWQVRQVIAAPVPAQYDYDEGVYAETADAAARGRRLYRDIFLSQPPVFVLALRAVFKAVGTSLVAARNTAVLFSVIWPFALLALLSIAGRPRAGAMAALMLLGSPAFVAMGHSVEMEIPGEALACASLAVAVLAVRRRRSLWWIAGGAVLVLAAMTKLTAATCAVPFAAVLATRSEEGRARRCLAAAIGGALVMAVLFPIIGTGGFLDEVVGFHLLLGRIPQALSLNKQAVIVAFLTRQLPLIAAAVIGMALAVSRGSGLERALAVWLAVDCVGLGALTPLWEHHLVIALSPLALLAGSGLDHACAVVSRQARIARWTTATACVCALGTWLALTASAARPSGTSPALRQMVVHLAMAVPPGGEVLTDDPMPPFLARRAVADQLIDTSLTRIWTGQISQDGLDAALHAGRTRAVLLWRGTFLHYFPGLEKAAAARFHFRLQDESGRVLFLTGEPGPAPRGARSSLVWSAP